MMVVIQSKRSFHVMIWLWDNPFNLDKYALMTSKNLSGVKMVEFGNILGIKHCTSLGHDLCMPSQNGWDKNQLFIRFKDHV